MKKTALILSLMAVASAAQAASIATPAFSNVRLPSGIVVVSLEPGSGPAPTSADTVTVNYRGTLEDGREFDSSYKRGVPATFSLAQVIPCWQNGIPEIKVGGKASLVCPSNTAYGPNGIPGVIPPNSVLKFEVQLLSIKSK